MKRSAESGVTLVPDDIGDIRLVLGHPVRFSDPPRMSMVCEDRSKSQLADQFGRKSNLERF